MTLAPTRVLSLNNFVVFVRFENGEIGCLDMKPFLNFGDSQKLKTS